MFTGPNQGKNTSHCRLNVLVPFKLHVNNELAYPSYLILRT